MSGERKPTVKDLQRDLNHHAAGMAVSHGEIREWHKAEWNRLVAELVVLRSKQPRLSQATQDERNLRHRHNGLFGSVGMAEANMRAVESSPTASLRAKELAQQVQQLLSQLRTELKTRRS